MKHLLKLKKLPQHFFNYERDYVAITRPEDIKDYDYLASLKEGKKIDFSQFRGSSSDISWEGWTYLLPYLQREWLYHYSDIIDDRLDELFWAFTSNKRFENIVKLLDQEDKSNLLSWMKYLRLEKQDQVFVYSNIDELNGFINFLEKEMETQPA